MFENCLTMVLLWFILWVDFEKRRVKNAKKGSRFANSNGSKKDLR